MYVLIHISTYMLHIFHIFSTYLQHINISGDIADIGDLLSLNGQLKELNILDFHSMQQPVLMFKKLSKDLKLVCDKRYLIVFA